MLHEIEFLNLENIDDKSKKNLNLENIDDKSKKVAAEEDNHDTEQHDSQTCKGASIWTPIL